MTGISKLYRNLNITLIISTFTLIVMGGLVKAFNAGLACPDWPLCYGKLFPFLSDTSYPFPDWKIFLEWFHRLLAMSVGFLVIYITYRSFNYREELPVLPKLSSLLLVLFGSQVILGGLTVLQRLDPLIVVIHLGNAVMIIMLEMIMTFLIIFQMSDYTLDHSARDLLSSETNSTKNSTQISTKTKVNSNIDDSVDDANIDKLVIEE